MESELRRVVVVGGGTAGWLTASLLHGRLAADGVEVCLVESPDVPTIGVGEGSTPQMVQGLLALGIDNSEWMPACKATRKMGIRFEGWGRRDFSHPFFLFGDASTYDGLRDDDPDLLPRLARVHRDDHSFSLDDTFIAPAVWREPLYERYVTELADRVTWGAYHFDAGLLGALLRDRARAAGVRHVLANVLAAERDEAGDLRRLRLDAGAPIDGDLFFDCTGFRALLLGDELGEPFVGYQRSLFCDRALALKLPWSDGRPTLPPRTVSTALEAGWVWQIPLTDALGCGYVFSSAWASDDEAERELRRFLAATYGEPESFEPRAIPFRTGRRRNAWVRNCVGVGLAANFVEPLEATSIAMTLASVARFLLRLDRGGLGAAERDDYNREIAELNDHVRDFIVMHYVSASRRDTPFWRACHEETHVPASLAAILDGWRERGRLEVEPLFFHQLSWFCVLTGGNDYPRRQVLEAVADGAPAVAARLRRLRRRNVRKYRRHMEQELAGA